MDVAISIIVPCRGRPEELRACLCGLFSQQTDIPYEVLAVYYEGDADVKDVVKDFPLIRSVTSGSYLLPGEARNLGTSHAAADMIGFIDSDCIPDPQWVSTAVQTIQDGAVLCSGAILDKKPWDFIASSDNRLQYADFPPARPYGVASYFSGAHLAVKKEAFQKVGGFPSLAHGQDVLFTQKIAKTRPLSTIFNPNLRALHYGRSNWSDFLEHQTYFGFSRSYDGIQLNEFMIWTAKHPWLGWVILLRRLAYITFRVLQWNLRDTLRYLLQLPIILIGLLYWTNGFYKGFRDRTQTEPENWRL